MKISKIYNNMVMKLVYISKKIMQKKQPYGIIIPTQKCRKW